MLEFLKKNKVSILISAGILLTLASIFNLLNFAPGQFFKNLRSTTTINQAGFAPIFLPDPENTGFFTAQQTDAGRIPRRIVIDAINLDAPIFTAEIVNVEFEGEEVVQFLVPEEFAAGWHEGSAPLGVSGNTVISGHHNAYGKVFAGLVDLIAGDSIIIQSSKRDFKFIIANKMILPEKEEPLDVHIENARWILPSSDERITLVTCWPADSNTHRLILVAVPADTKSSASYIMPTPTPALSVDLKTPAVAMLAPGTATPTSEAFFVRSTGKFSINIHEAPDETSPIIGALQTGEDAEALGRTASADWIFILYDELDGWVSAGQIETSRPIENLPLIPIQQ